MNKQINHSAVVMMAKTGFHPEAIAARLECSRKQVDRILKAKDVKTEPYMKDFNFEHELWKHFRNVYGESYTKIALRFGVTRQAVQKFFTDLYGPTGRKHLIDTSSKGQVYLHDIEDAEFELIDDAGTDPHLDPLPGEETPNLKYEEA